MINMAKILVVDDEIGIRELLSDILSDEGFMVTTAENADDARIALKKGTYDLILLDIWMPDTDGITLLKELSARKLLTCPVIMMSGHATIDSAVEAVKFGALAFLEKPISMAKLLETVNHGLEVKDRIVRMGRYRPEEPEIKEEPVVEPPKEIHDLPVVNVAGIEIDFNLSLREVRETTEKAYLTALMTFENCQMTRVARRAGLERTHLYRKLKSLNMEIPRAAKHAGEKTEAGENSGENENNE